MIDPLSAAIESAVARAIDARMPLLIDAITHATLMAKPPKSAEPDEFVRLKDACSILKVHKTTVHRLARKGDFPPIEHMGKRAGYRRSTLAKIMKTATGEARSGAG